MSDSTYLLEMKGISKSYPPIQALKKVNFKLTPGSVHVLVGENGAGKSTLMKILSGEEQPDEGEMIYRGQKVRFATPRAAQDARIAIIHQELTPIYDMNVAENLFLGRYISKLGGLLMDRRRLYENAKALLGQVRLNVSPKSLMRDLTVAQIQMVEIAKAISRNARIIIMDEPTSAISDSEVTTLFQIIEKLKQQGVGIVYISHKMDEIFQIADEITIFRDGFDVGHYLPNEIDRQTLIEKMVDRPVNEIFPQKKTKPGDCILSIEDLSCGKLFQDISFKLHKGEILGLGGLMGAGRTEIVETLFGIMQPSAGTLKLKGKTVTHKHPRQAIRNGIGLITDDRKRKGLVLDMDISQNIVMASYDKISNLSILNPNKIRQIANRFAATLRLNMYGLRQLVGNLSGGNQQKVVLAKWMVLNPDILIFDEPTRGIDIGAKEEIYRLISQLAEQGKAIIYISSEMQEMVGMCDRILVLNNGRMTGELKEEDICQTNIMKLASA